jgi:glutamate-1-semialdehyde aminotransferase
VDYEPEDDTLPPTADARKMLAGAGARARLCLHLLQRGISTMGARFFVLSAAHSEEDLDRTVDALVASLEAMKAEPAP